MSRLAKCMKFEPSHHSNKKTRISQKYFTFATTAYSTFGCRKSSFGVIIHISTGQSMVYFCTLRPRSESILHHSVCSLDPGINASYNKYMPPIIRIDALLEEQKSDCEFGPRRIYHLPSTVRDKYTLRIC
jgi:hypothetical protein